MDHSPVPRYTRFLFPRKLLGNKFCWHDTLSMKAFVLETVLHGMETSIFTCFFFSW